MSPWRQRYITTRRHPLAFAAFLVTATLGLMYAVGLLSTSPTFDGVAHIWRLLWRWEMVTGGLGGVLALSLPPRTSPRWPDLADMLRFEGIAALVSGIGLITYGTGIIMAFGVHRGTTTWALLYILGVGMLYRGIQALHESTVTERMAVLAKSLREKDTELRNTETYQATIDEARVGEEKSDG